MAEERDARASPRRVNQIATREAKEKNGSVRSKSKEESFSVAFL